MSLQNGLQKQTPQDEAKERLAEATPLYMVPRLMAAEDYRASAAAYRNRTYDAHKLGMRMLGVPAEEILPPIESKDMGDLSISGDSYQYFPQAPAQVAAPAPAPVPAPTPTPTPVPTEAKKNSWTVPLLAAAIGLGGLGAGLGLSTLGGNGDSVTITNPSNPANPPAYSDRDWKVRAYVSQPESPPTRPNP